MFRDYTKQQLLSRSKDETTRKPSFDQLMEASLDMVEHKQEELRHWFWLYMNTLKELQKLKKGN